MTEKLKGFNHPWHLAHQYELSKLPFVEWTWLIQHKRPYSPRSRGDFVKNWAIEYEEGKYDFALLHLDQQCIEEELLKRGKGLLYMELNERIKDIPKIVIMHGTPYYPEKFSMEYVVDKVKELVGENTMVVNSYKAAEQFGFGIPIVHGIDPNEWWDLPKEPRVVISVSPAGLDKYYDRDFTEAVISELEERGVTVCHIGVNWKPSDRSGNEWDNYRNFIGRSLIFLNLTKDSPMPRARTEAMLSGCCVLTTPWQDADTFIKDGENGFIIPRNPQSVADKVQWLMEHYDLAIKVGKAGKQTMIERFTVEAYQQKWKDLLEKVTGKKL